MQGPEKLLNSIPNIQFIPFLIASVIIAAAYGSNFLLPEHLNFYGFDTGVAGSVISIGVITTIICCFLAGLVAKQFGIIKTLILAAFSMVVAMLCFALIGIDVRAAYIGSLMLGIGWSSFFILAPLEIIQNLQPDARISYLTILSGAQMAGLGLATPIGRLLANYTHSPASVYIIFALFSVVAMACLGFIHRKMPSEVQPKTIKLVITPSDVFRLLQTKTVFPLIMIILAACSFSGLSTYQTAYAKLKLLRPDIFFLVFTVTSVILRFSLARTISKINIQKLALILFIVTAGALLLFIANPGSTAVYIFSTVLFAIGYGLSYSTLNAMAVNLAEIHNISASVTSQVFTLAYFFGLFGFPYIGGALIRVFDIKAMLILLMLAAFFNIGLIVNAYKKP